MKFSLCSCSLQIGRMAPQANVAIHSLNTSCIIITISQIVEKDNLLGNCLLTEINFKRLDNFWTLRCREYLGIYVYSLHVSIFRFYGTS